MKKYLLLLLSILSLQKATAQLNLVPNPSFEDTVYCPTGIRQIDASQHWLNFGNTPDYFNACSNPVFGVPNSTFGFQYAHTGNAYAGAVFYLRPSHPSGPNYREFIGVELINNLIVGQKYFVSFYVVNAAVNNGSVACNKHCINFYTVPFDSCCPPPLINTSKLFTDSILIDTLNWTKISGSFIADSAYQYLCIGNLFNDTNTDTILTSLVPVAYHAYYYIDDICLSTDSLYNETWTGLNQNEEKVNSISIFPNPSIGFFTVESPIPIEGYSLFNMKGQLIIEKKEKSSLFVQIDMTNQPNGIYILNINSKQSISKNKIILTY